MIQTKLAALVREKAKYGEQIQHPASEVDIVNLRSQVFFQFGCELSNVYSDILSITNGIDENGYELYSTEKNSIIGKEDSYVNGLIEANTVWHDDRKRSTFLTYGQSGLEIFAMRISDSTFFTLDRITLDVFEEHDDDVQLFSNLLDLMLS